MREIGVVAAALFLGLACGWAFDRVIFVNRVDGSPLAGTYRCDQCGHNMFYESSGDTVCTKCQAHAPMVVSPLPKELW